MKRNGSRVRGRWNRAFAYDNYNFVGNHPVPWFSRAQGLYKAAHLMGMCTSIAPRERNECGPTPPEEALAVDLLPVERMLFAMAMETMLKGVLVRAGAQLVADSRYCSIRGVNDHDLVGLAKRLESCTDLRFGEETLDRLRRLAPWITSGRYPVARHVDHTLDMLVGVWSTKDRAEYDVLWERLMAGMWSINEDQSEDDAS